ncbi:MAG: pirin family protein [Planctomycetes bacterium]|nr:pirin family protein [Planctomycetota bacterium]
MLKKRAANQRGHGQHGWLDTYHTFSFNDYHDPDYMGFRVLRVMNEDRVQPGQGFGTHGHRDMEIITYVLDGALAHQDNLGTGEVLRPGEFQRMTAGTGIQHSEFNASKTEPVHFYQIWIIPRQRGLPPSYEQRTFPVEERTNRLRLVASSDGRDGSLTVQQDVEVFLSTLGDSQQVAHELKPGRYAWLQVLRGAVLLNDLELVAGDGAAVTEEAALVVRATKPSEVMLFDLP